MSISQININCKSIVYEKYKDKSYNLVTKLLPKYPHSGTIYIITIGKECAYD